MHQTDYREEAVEPDVPYNGGEAISNTNTDRLNPPEEEGATYLLKGGAGVTFPPNLTALLVIDPVNDFLSERGRLGDGEDHR